MTYRAIWTPADSPFPESVESEHLDDIIARANTVVEVARVEVEIYADGVLHVTLRPVSRIAESDQHEAWLRGELA